MAAIWTFTQLGGPAKELKLEGYQAPFGRPRRAPVLVEKFQQKIQTVRYPGKNAVPTRHILNAHWDDFELSGRWMDKTFPGFGRSTDGRAANLADQWIEFIRDGERVRISWGNIVTYFGIVESIELARESPFEIAWKMRVLVDERPELASHRPQEIPSIKGLLQAIEAELALFLSVKAPSLKLTIPDWKPDILDFIDSFVSSINSFSSSFLKIANQFDNLATGLTSELFRLESAVRSFKYAINQFSMTLETLETDTVLFGRQAESDINWVKSRSEMLLSMNSMTALLSIISRLLDIEIRGKTVNVHVARIGDTWEIISILMFQTPDRANDIRQANSIQYGELPVPGRTYQIPQ